MPFDSATRNRLQKFVSEARDLLVEEFTRQMRQDFGMDPETGTLAGESAWKNLDDAGFQTAREIRDLAVHYEAADPSGGTRAALQRIVREQTFTALNRLCALRMAETRGFLMESLGKAEESGGFRMYRMLAQSALGETMEAYRAFLLSLFDEFAEDLPVLFDRFAPEGRLFPRENALRNLLEKINDPDIAPLWAEDETIGWIYQYFNSQEERRRMRAESQAPRNSRELAVRNQFFTPRYVVEFLTDNTLGRIWYEMTQGETALAERCRFLVRRPDEVFLNIAEGKVWDWLRGAEEIEVAPPTEVALAHAVNGYRRFGNPGEGGAERSGEVAKKIREDGPEEISTQDLLDFLFMIHRGERFTEGLTDRFADVLRRAFGEVENRVEKSREDSLSQEEMLGLPVFIPLRRPKDPRDIRVLDPACGSGHFLLYAFDLLMVIYEEAWERGWTGDSREFGDERRKSLRELYPDRDALRKDLPRLILRHNLYGVDIDDRAAQMAGLSLWLRAQREWREQGVAPADRPRIRKSNIVCAEPMPGDSDLLADFCEDLSPRVLGELVKAVFSEMELAGEAGALLKIEEKISGLVAEKFEKFKEEVKRRKARVRGQEFLPGMDAGRPVQMELDEFLDLPDETNFWETAEDAVIRALRAYAERAENGDGARKRLFAEDAAKGFAFIDLCRLRYDVVLMNPPFGDFSRDSKTVIQKQYPLTKNDIYAAFVERGVDMLHRRSMLGAITSRTGFFLSSFQNFREKVLLEKAPPTVVADLGHGVLDNAMVEVAAYCLEAA